MSWREGKKRVSRFFQTEVEREAFLEKNSHLGQDCMSLIMQLSKDELKAVADIKRLKGDVAFSTIWDFWKRNNKSIELVTVWNACDSYIKNLKVQNRDKNYITRVRRILEQFCDMYQNVFVEHITRQNIEDWLNALPYTGQTKQNYKDILRASWSYFERQNWISKNVANKLKTEKIIKSEIGILTVEETKRLLRVNEDIDPEICGLIALGLFAGMRSSGIARLSYDEIKFAERGIEIPAHKAKSGRRCYIENLPENLWAWLERTPKSAFEMSERNYKKRRENAYRRAGLIVTAEDVKKAQSDKRSCEVSATKLETRYPPHNAFRHSFVSYHVALHRRFQDTALLVSHKGTNILFEHYLGVATKENAEKYFAIYPKDYAKSIEQNLSTAI